MTKLNIAQALKQKNRLAGEISRIGNLIIHNNSQRVDTKTKVDVSELLSNRDNIIKELVELKAKINKASAPISEKLIELAELKGQIDFFKAIPVKEGVFVENQGYRSDGEKVEYSAHLNVVDVENKVVSIQSQINNLQDEIDEYNYTTKI